ncbi:MAG: S-layer homology domain-containing protein [Lawsonibacter sp.]
MKHRVTAVLTAVCLSLALVLPASAAPSATDAAQVVNALGIMVGDAQGNMNLYAQVTRAEFITMAVKASPGGEQIGQAATSPYPDVPWTHWASGYVEAGVARGLISGYSDGTFRPSNHIRLAEGVTIALRLLGYGPEDFSGAYPTGQMAMYRSLGLDAGVTVTSSTAAMKRQDAMYLFYNLMTAKTKEGTPYLETLGHKLNDAGEIDLVSLINDAMDGPVVVQGNWEGSIPFSVSGAKVYRQGKLSTVSAIQPLDVLYWNRAMNTLWAYCDRVTGTVQALEPSSASPTSVTVAGRTCKIETAAAAFALSDLGGCAVGDTVTLLLGRGGGVAAVVDPSSVGGSSVAQEQVGVVTAIENATYSDGKGGTYTARTAVVMATDGQIYRHESPSGLSVGSLVRITASDQAGGVTLRSLSTVSLSGTVNAAGTKVGNFSFASGVEILDVSEGMGVRVYPNRLAGVDLTGQVSYYTLNGAGEINRMILKGVTGDMYLYGILTQMEETNLGEYKSSYSYRFDVGGQVGTLMQTDLHFPVELGPIQIKGTLQAPEKLYALTSAKTGDIQNNQFVAGEKRYTLSDQVAVYEKRGDNYYISSLARVSGGEFTLTGWYDKVDNKGGRIRVILAQ